MVDAFCSMSPGYKGSNFYNVCGFLLNKCGYGEGLERRAWGRRGGKRGGDGGGWWLREWSELDLRIGKG